MKSEKFFLILLLIINISCDGKQKQEHTMKITDHHLHVRSAQASEALYKIQKTLTPEQEIQLVEPILAKDIIKLLDSAAIDRGVLLSLSYFYGFPTVDFEDEYQKVKQENDFVAEQSLKYPDRLIAFASVNPLADYAIEEVKRIGETKAFTGLKLHFGNSNVNLRDSLHLQKLQELFREAYSLDLAAVVHLWNPNPEYGARDARIFIHDVLGQVPNMKVQVAHLGGGGLFNEIAENVAAEFIKAKKEKPEVMDADLVFDIGASAFDPQVFLNHGDTSRATAIEDSNRKLAQTIEELGVEHVVFGSDFWARDPAHYVKTIRSLPLSQDLIHELLKNTAPYIKD